MSKKKKIIYPHTHNAPCVSVEMDETKDAKRNRSQGPRRSSMGVGVYVLLALLMAVLIFHAGMFIVGMKTDYLERWAGHQYFGEIVKIDGENFAIRDRDDSQREVQITKKTVFRKGTETVDNNLRPGDRVIVFGLLNEGGKIEAGLIRIFDPNDRTKWQKLFSPPFKK